MKRKLVVICCFFFGLYSMSFGYINVHPISFDQRIDGLGAIRDFTLVNTTNRTLKYKIDILNSENEKDMSAWTEVYPKVVTLGPGKKGEIKMYVKAPKNTAVGEYSTIFNIKELGIPSEKKSKKKLEVFTDLRLKLYGYVGELDAKISLTSFKISKGKNIGDLKLAGIIKNTGLRRTSLEIVLSDKKEKEGILIGEVKLKKGEKIDLSTLGVMISKDKKISNYSGLDTVFIYEKGGMNCLKKIEI